MHETVNLAPNKKKNGKPRPGYVVRESNDPVGLVSRDAHRGAPTVEVNEFQGTQGIGFVKKARRGPPTVDAHEYDQFNQLLNGDSKDDESGIRKSRGERDGSFSIPLTDENQTKIQRMDVPLSESAELEARSAREAARQKEHEELLKRKRAMTEILLEVPLEKENMTKEEREIVYMRQREYSAQAALLLGMPEAMADRFRDLPYRYLPLRKLSSQGNMGTVYEVKDLGLPNRPLIMKTISDASDRKVERFKQEARIMASIQNHHVVRVVNADFLPDGSGGWYTMEKGDGPDLHTTIDRQPLRMKDALEMMSQTADGLDIVHAKGIAHRDIKPANIIVHQEYDKDGNPMELVYKFIDFGLAKPIAVEENKLDWIKEQFVEAPNKSVLDSKLKEFGFSDSQRASIVSAYEDFASDEDLVELKTNDWRKKLAQSEEGSQRLKRLRECVDQLPRGKPELAYDLYLRDIERQKRFWVFAEITRLSKLEKPRADQVLLAPHLQVSVAVRAKMAMMAEWMQKDPSALYSDDVERIVDQVSVDESRLSEDGTLIGTPAYMSPEQIESGVMDTKSDVFSLGVVWYEALAGRNPFGGGSIHAVLAKMTQFEPPVVSLIRPDVSPALSALIASMMNKDPNLRPSIKEAKAELAKIRKEIPANMKQAEINVRVKESTVPESDKETQEVKRQVNPDEETGIISAESQASDDETQSRVMPIQVPPTEQPAPPKSMWQRVKGVFGR